MTRRGVNEVTRRGVGEVTRRGEGEFLLSIDNTQRDQGSLHWQLEVEDGIIWGPATSGREA